MAYAYYGEREGNPALEHRRRVQQQVRIRRNMRDSSNPFEMSVTEFTLLYRMPQHLMLDLINILRPYVRPWKGAAYVPLEVKVLCAVGFFAVGSYQRPHGRSADLNVSQSAVSVYIKEIMDALNHPNILIRFIRFPTTHEEIEATENKNLHLGMPRTLGYIDGTLVRIVPPPGEKQVYRSRKGFTALNVQIVCDADLFILNVNARFPGSSNDPFLYRVSGVRHVMMEAFRTDRCWLLGDSIYPHEPWLMTPLHHAEPGTPEYAYTKLHCHGRNCVERCIGVLKGRWRCLLIDRTLHYTPEKAGRIINSCVVLHNFLTIVKAPQPAPLLEDLGHEIPDDDVLEEDFELMREADEVRRYLIASAYARWLRIHEND